MNQAPAPKDAPKVDAKDVKVETKVADDGAVSSILSATPTGVTQDDLNPAFAGPESQAKTKKDWTEGAEHTPAEKKDKSDK